MLAGVAVALRERLGQAGHRVGDRLVGLARLGRVAAVGDAPAARGPRSLHGLHGRQRQGLGAHGADPLRHARRHGHALDRAHAGRLELEQDALERLVTRQLAGLGQDDQELVRARAADHVVHPRGLLQDRAHGLEQLVGNPPAVARVELVEAVHVEGGHRQRAAVPARALHLGHEPALEGLFAGEAGQRVALGPPRQLGFELREAAMRLCETLFELLDLTLGAHRSGFGQVPAYLKRCGAAVDYLPRCSGVPNT